MAKLRNRIIFMFTSNYGRLVISCILMAIGAMFGLGGTFEINDSYVWDIIFFIGMISLLIHFFIFAYYAVVGTVSDFTNRKK